MQPLDLIDHPEGGRYREVFRSAKEVQLDSSVRRSALTHIYFQLRGGERSRFHRVSSDEVWNLYRGAGLRLFQWDASDNPPTRIELSAANETFCHVVPAGMWQAAMPIDGGVLVGCSVAPGFEFCDFELMEKGSVEATRLSAIAAELSDLTGSP